MAGYKCRQCGVVFANARQLGGHHSSGWKCVPTAKSPEDLSANSPNERLSPNSSASPPNLLPNFNDNASSLFVPRVVPCTIAELLWRPTAENAKHFTSPTLLRPGSQAHVCSHENTYKLHEVQEAYDKYCVQLRQMYAPEFWRILGSVYRERAGVIDRVLKTTSEVFVRRHSAQRQFPTSVRTLRTSTLRRCGNFPSHVMHKVSIDLSEFQLPGNVQSVNFTFVNPLWAWVGAANEMIRTNHEVHFKAARMKHEVTGETLYGGGVQYGDVLKFAASRTPKGGKPALFGISFDGGDSGVSTRSVCPICVSALNFNGADPLQCGLVGYMPVIPVPESFKEGSDKFSKLYVDAKTKVTQGCIGAVLDEIESVARDGFTARIGKKVTRLHPFLVAVRVDSKERKTYFGLKSDRACAICRFRKGWSSLRMGTHHGKGHINRLWRLAIDSPRVRKGAPGYQAQKRAREQLVRHGFSERKRRYICIHIYDCPHVNTHI